MATLVSRLSCEHCMGEGEIHIEGEREYVKERHQWYVGLGSVEDCEKCSDKAKCLDCGKEFDDGEEIACAIQPGADNEWCCPHCTSDNWELIEPA